MKHTLTLLTALLLASLTVSQAAELKLAGQTKTSTDDAPPTPKWLFGITRVAFTARGNHNLSGDWPEKVIEDFAAAGVQMVSSCAQWDNINELAWKSAYGKLDPRLKGKLLDWEVVGGEPTDADAHSGRRCLRLLHTKDRQQTYLNRQWNPAHSGEQGKMLDILKGKLSCWYKVQRAKNANIWLGALPMSEEPRANTGAPRAGVQIPPEHVGDGQWHQVIIPYDYTNSAKVKWIHASCTITGEAAEVLLDDFECVGVHPQPATNGSFEEVGPDRDGTREVVALCRKHGMRYIANYLAQRETVQLGEAHPDWRCVNSKGNKTAYFCINTPYRGLVRNRIVELVKDVGVDGIFFDMFHTRPDECYCPACKAKFKQETGQEPPIKEDFDSLLWQQWVNFKYRSIESAMLDFNRAMKAVNAEAALIVNSFNAWVYRSPLNSRNSIRVIENVDGLLEEIGWYDRADPSFFAFPARDNFMNWHLAGLCKQKPAFMWSLENMPGWLNLTSDEPRIRVLTMMTNGSVPAFSAPGRDVVKQYMGEIAGRDEYFRGAKLFPWCGLVMSEKTEIWYGRDDPKGRYIKGIYGAYQAMLERHLPVSLVTDRELEQGVLNNYKVLFMPNCAAMSEAEMESVRRFVRNGGGLVATYETSLYDEHARLREAFGLADVLKAKKVGAFENLDLRPLGRSATLIMAPEHRWSADPVILKTLSVRAVNQPVSTLTRHIPLHCRMLLVKPEGGTPSPLRLTTADYNPKTLKVNNTNHVAVIESTYGKGKVIYLPFDISWSFFRYGHEYLGRVLELALRDTASAAPPVEVKAPTVVQAMTHCQGDRLVVHLLNDISSFGRSQNVAGESLYLRREVIPIHDIELTFRDKGLHRFFLVPGKELLKPESTAQGTIVRVPRLDIHRMVVAEP